MDKDSSQDKIDSPKNKLLLYGISAGIIFIVLVIFIIYKIATRVSDNDLGYTSDWTEWKLESETSYICGTNVKQYSRSCLLDDGCPDGEESKSVMEAGDISCFEGVRYIRVYREGLATDVGVVNNFLNISAINVFDENNININDKITINAGSEDSTDVAANLLDGSTETQYRNISGNDPIENIWVKLDLGIERNLSKVVIINRQDCCNDRIYGISVEFLDKDENQVFYSGMNEYLDLDKWVINTDPNDVEKILFV